MLASPATSGIIPLSDAPFPLAFMPGSCISSIQNRQVSFQSNEQGTCLSVFPVSRRNLVPTAVHNGIRRKDIVPSSLWKTVFSIFYRYSPMIFHFRLFSWFVFWQDVAHLFKSSSFYPNIISFGLSFTANFQWKSFFM